MNALHYYVYYRIEPARLEAMHVVTGELFLKIKASTGVQGRLLRRRDDSSTWMEIYENVTDGPAFERALDSALLATGFAGLQATRKTEIFQCA